MLTFNNNLEWFVSFLSSGYSGGVKSNADGWKF